MGEWVQGPSVVTLVRLMASWRSERMGDRAHAAFRELERGQTTT